MRSIQAQIDRQYGLLELSDVVLAKAAGLSEVSQIARSESRLRAMYEAKWSARSAEATAKATSMASNLSTPGAISKAINKIMGKWPSDVTATFKREHERVYKLARSAGHKKATGKTKASLSYNTKNFTEVITGEPVPSNDDPPIKKAKGKKPKKPKRKATVSFVFDLEDAAALEALERQQVFWIGSHYSRNVEETIRQTSKDVMSKHGGNGKLAGKAMAAAVAKDLAHVTVPGGFNGSSAKYFEGLSANAVTTARVAGQLRSFSDIGIKRYTISNPSDRRTCPVCNHMDGKVFTVKQGMEQMNSVLAAKKPADIRSIHPWIRAKQLLSISPKPGPQGEKDAGKLAAAGFPLPPFHFRCRDTVDIDESSASFGDLE